MMTSSLQPLIRGRHVISSPTIATYLKSRQKTGAAYISMKRTGIDRPEKIEGHSVALTPGASTTQLFAGFVAANRLDHALPVQVERRLR